MQHHNDTINKLTQEDFFINICTSHFIVRVRKELLKVCVWEGAGDRTETAIFWPHSHGRQSCAFLVPLMLNRRGPALCWVMAFFTASYQQLLWSPNSIGVPEGPFGRVWLSLPHLVYNFVRSLTATHQGPQDPFGLMWLYLPHLVHLSHSKSNWNSLTSVLTELYNSSTSAQSPTRFLESHVGSSFSGNHFHAVHR